MKVLAFKYRALIAACLISVPLDQWTKHLVHTKFYLGESVSLIPGIFSLTYVRNKGAAFGFLNSAPDSFREPFFIAVPLIALFAIGYTFFKMQNDQRLAPLGLSLVVSGAVGNLIDRLRFGFVVDFLDVYWESHHWPAFNVADSAIVVGVGLLLVHSFFFQEKASTPA